MVLLFVALYGSIDNNTVYPNVYEPIRPQAIELEGSFRKESIYELITRYIDLRRSKKIWVILQLQIIL